MVIGIGPAAQGQGTHIPTMEEMLPEAEYNALLSLYANTGGPGWTNRSGWLDTGPTPDNWWGVLVEGVVLSPTTGFVTQKGHVTAINLRGNNLTGFIPSAIANLPSLTSLDFSFNNLTGVIPTQLGSLVALRHLSLSTNHLTGTIPSSFGDLASLEFLSLTSNELTGSIPVWLGDLTALEYLYLAGNHLSGSIPAALGDLPSLLELWLEGNQFTGEIPAALGNLTDLEHLDLSNNELTGELPASLGNLTALLESPDFSANRLCGGIPPSVLALCPIITSNYYTLDTAFWDAWDAACGGLAPDSFIDPQECPDMTLEPWSGLITVDNDGSLHWNEARLFSSSSAKLKVTNLETIIGPIKVTIESDRPWLTVRNFEVGAPPAGPEAHAHLQPGGDMVFTLAIDLPNGSPCGEYRGTVKIFFGGCEKTIDVCYAYSRRFLPAAKNGFTGEPIAGATIHMTTPNGLPFDVITGADGYPTTILPVWWQGVYLYTADAPGGLASVNPPAQGALAGTSAIWQDVLLFESDPPAGGMMDIDPAPPLKRNSKFTVRFAGWHDLSPPLSYELLVDGVVVSASGGSTSRVLISPAAPGPHILMGRIRDAGGNMAERTRNFTVNPPDPIEPPDAVFAGPPGVPAGGSGFREFFFGTTSNTGNAADGADSDGDGLLNLLEWALMLDPTKPSTLPAVLNKLDGTLEFLYIRNATATAAGAVFIVEWSETMAANDWHTTGVTQAILSDNGAVQQVKAAIPAGTNGERFVRLRVVGP